MKAELMETAITSMEVAQMVGKDHSKLLRDIRNYVSQLGEAKIGFTDFFTESTYVTEQNKIMPCFMVTKKGCEFIAHKLNGRKGTEFTARYINRFHEMEQELLDQRSCRKTVRTEESLAAVNSTVKILLPILTSAGCSGMDILRSVAPIYGKAGIILPVLSDPMASGTQETTRKAGHDTVTDQRTAGSKTGGEQICDAACRETILAFLDIPITADWYKMTTLQRRNLIHGGDFTGGTVLREKVCIAEIWNECFGMDRENLRYKDADRISAIMRTLPGWEKIKSVARFGAGYGTQKGYRRIEEQS